MQNIFIELLPPWVETGLQPAFYDKESGTVLQQVSRMWAKMIELGAGFNKFTEDTADTVNTYIQKFVELYNYVHDYFDNLDVQEEINNKLDAMQEAGTLQEIITTYIQSNVAWTFDTVADMKLATNLVDGSFTQTLGFRAKNDGGGAIYKISDTGTANEMDVIAVDDLYATLVDNKEVNAKQFGCYGDGTHDDTTALQQAIDYTSTNKCTLKITDGTYMVNAVTSLIMKSNVKVDFSNAKIKAIPNDQTTYSVIKIYDCKNCIFNDAVIEGERDEHTGDSGEFGYGVDIRGDTSNIVFNNLTVSNCWGDGIFFYRTRVDDVDYIPEGVYFNGVTKITNCRRQGVSFLAGKSVYFDTLKVKKIDGTNPMAGVDIESEHPVDLLGDININLLYCDQTKKAFTMRTRSLIVGNIHVGTVIHENPVGYAVGANIGYEPSFRVMFEYFDDDQAKYSVSVDEVYSEKGCLQLENLYNGVTPKVIIGDVHTKEKYHFYAETPATSRSLVNVNYPLTTDLSNSLGNLQINSVVIDKVIVPDTTMLNDFSVLKVNYSGNTALSSLKFENVRIGEIECTEGGEYINFGSSNSSVVFSNAYFTSRNIKNVYERKDSGTFSHITSGGNTVYFLPATDPTASKTIQLRVRNSLQPMSLKCVGNSTVKINTANQTTQFTGVNLNGTDLTGTDGIYEIGTFSTGADFNITTDGGIIYLQQIS